jgi:hypothetical protein
MLYRKKIIFSILNSSIAVPGTTVIPIRTPDITNLFRVMFLTERVDENVMLEVIKRLQRVVMIIKLLVDQVFFRNFDQATPEGCHDHQAPSRPGICSLFSSR